MLITHAMGVVAEVAQRVVVMYAGKVVEEAPVAELFAHPRHPYTQGLIRSIPRLDLAATHRQRLEAIPGTVPNLLHPPVGCRFAARCRFATDAGGKLRNVSCCSGVGLAWAASMAGQTSSRNAQRIAAHEDIGAPTTRLVGIQ